MAPSSDPMAEVEQTTREDASHPTTIVLERDSQDSGLNGNRNDVAANESLQNDKSQGHDAEASGDEDHAQDVEPEHVGGAKKRKKRKPKSKRGLKAPTGLEEFFADAPLTPAEHEEEQALYAPDLPFINRILTAIQRFERTRRLVSERRDIFYKYLAYGGVEISPNMFQSVSDIDKKNMTKDELAVALSQASIGADKYDIGSPNALYEVDFVGCAKAFLSRRATILFGLETREKIVEVTSTIERFMDYLHQHDVCPEYKQEILETRDFCRKAPDELCALTEAGRLLPGDFNIACSTLYEGAYADLYDGETYWGPETPGESNFVGFTNDTAFQIIAYAMSGAAPESVFRQYERQLRDPDNGVRVVEIRPQSSFEITEIIPPTKKCLKLYQSESQDFRPVGLVRGRAWIDPGAAPVDLTAEERAEAEKAAFAAHIKLHSPKERAEYTFIIEQNVQLNLYIGMKIQATLRKLSCGIWFFDEFQSILPSFDTYIANDLMLDYTKPRWLAGSIPYEEEQDRLRAEEEKRLAEEDALALSEKDDDDHNHADEAEVGVMSENGDSVAEAHAVEGEDDEDFEL